MLGVVEGADVHGRGDDVAAQPPQGCDLGLELAPGGVAGVDVDHHGALDLVDQRDQVVQPVGGGRHHHDRHRGDPRDPGEAAGDLDLVVATGGEHAEALGAGQPHDRPHDRVVIDR